MIRRGQRGVAIIEFALILPLLVLLSYLVVDFGRAVHEYNAIAKSVRNAVRFVSMEPIGTCGIQDRVIYAHPNGASSGARVVAPGLVRPGVTIDCIWRPADATLPVNTVTVRVIGYEFQPMLSSFPGLTLLPAVRFADITATMRSTM